MRRALLPCCTFLVTTLVVTALPARAQIPDTFENLQLLDKDIERPQLVGIMQSWAGQLGVRCNHCHVGPDNLQGMDFASDEKATKRTARRMLIMARWINGEGLAELPILESEGRETAQHVQCVTCHRGLPKPPRPTSDLLAESLEAGGPDAAIDEFETLRSEHANAGRYDLTESPLFDLGRNLLKEGKTDEGRKLIVAMLVLFPRFADGHVLLGQAELMAGHLDAAQSALDAARRLEPDNRFSKWLEQMIKENKAAATEAATEDASH